MEHKNFILLMSLSAQNARFGQSMLAKIKRDIDSGATPAWIDSRGIGVFISSALNAREIWKQALPEGSTATPGPSGFQDMLVLQLGRDCLGYPSSRSMAWLNSHRAGSTDPT